MNVKHNTSPSPAASHAAFVACQAARDAIRLGADESQAANTYAVAYAAVMRGER